MAKREPPFWLESLFFRCFSASDDDGTLPTAPNAPASPATKRKKNPALRRGFQSPPFETAYSGTGRLLSAQICCTRAFNSIGSEEILATVNSDP